MKSLAYDTMLIMSLHKPKRPHKIELLEPIERVYCVTVCWPIKYHMTGSPIKVTDYYLPTLGMDGI